MSVTLVQDSPSGAMRLFDEVFWPLYPPDVRDDLRAARASVLDPANDCGVHELIDEIAEAFKFLAPSILGLPSSALDDTDASVHRIGAALTRDMRDRLLAERTFGQTRTPLLAMIAVHGTLYVGRCVALNHPGRWLVRRPLWESTVRLSSSMGESELALFQWWLKSLSDEEVDRKPLGDRYRTYVEVPCFEGSALPVIAPANRDVPRLVKPSYRGLFRHLKAHVPEIRQPGTDFPSPERFAEMQLAWLDFIWVGGGRMLLVHGPSTLDGVHLYWMNANGFVKAAFFPGSPSSAHRICAEGEKLQVCVSKKGDQCTHEMPWWGP